MDVLTNIFEAFSFFLLWVVTLLSARERVK